MWLIQEDVLRQIEALGVRATDAQLEKFVAVASEAPEAAAARIRSSKGAKAQIQIDGILTERPSLLAMLLGLGGTSYQALRTALAQVDGDAEISELEMRINSPGGQVEGLFDTIAAIQAFSKPIRVVASNAQSAAYALAAAAGTIEAASHAATFGSIGVVGGFTIDDKRVEIANTASPHKRPDPTTPEGKSAIREHLDELHSLFVGAIAEGRAYHSQDPSFDPKLVSDTFGQGKTILAAQAKKLRMIDRAPKPVFRSVPAAKLAAQSQETTQPAAATADGGTQRKTMNKEEIRAQFPGVYEAIANEGRAAASAEGEAKERKRVLAHLKLGKTSGALDIAEKAIASGVSPQDDEVFAEYQSAAMNRRDSDVRQSDSDTAGAAVAGAVTTTADGGKDFGDAVAAAFEKNYPSRKAG